MFFTKPSPAAGIWDFYVARPWRDNFKFKYRAKNFVLREKLGGGNFGTCYEGLRITDDSERLSQSSRKATLTPDQKKRRVVLKRVNIDKQGVRKDFLQVGTMARGAAESGYVESYMCSKIKSNPIVSSSTADYQGNFTVDAADAIGGFNQGTQWLVWRFESDSTLGDALDGRLGPFPACLEQFVLGRVNKNLDPVKRDALVSLSL